MLVEHGTDVTAQSDGGMKPLHITSATSQSGQIGIARMFMARAADATAQYRDHWTLLNPASRMGQVDVARMLIECGADLNYQNKFWCTPLHFASYMENVGIARTLIEYGADLVVRTNDGETPFITCGVENGTNRRRSHAYGARRGSDTCPARSGDHDNTR